MTFQGLDERSGKALTQRCQSGRDEEKERKVVVVTEAVPISTKESLRL
jgi:hypothetical protein